MNTPQDEGRQWERDWAEMIDGEVQPGSGNQFYAKLDVRSKNMTWSCKYTMNKTFIINKALLDELDHATMAPGGDGKLPGMAIRSEIGEVIVMRAEDFLELMKQEPSLPASKLDARRKKATTNQLEWE